MFLFPIYLIVLVVITNRYVAGLFFRMLRGADFDRVRSDYEPTVTVVTPMFNEGRGIYDTVRSLMQQDYPAHKLSMVVVDDCSRDDSVEWAQRAAALFPGRVRVIQNQVNMGKRRGINRAVAAAESEII